MSCLVYRQRDGKSTLSSGGWLVNQLIISVLFSCLVIIVAQGSKLVPLINLISFSLSSSSYSTPTITLSALLPLLDLLSITLQRYLSCTIYEIRIMQTLFQERKVKLVKNYTKVMCWVSYNNKWWPIKINPNCLECVTVKDPNQRIFKFYFPLNNAFQKSFTTTLT